MLNDTAECLQVEKITLKILYNHGQKPKINKHIQKKMLNITTLLCRNPQRKKVKWMWNEHRSRISNYKAADLLWRIRLNSLLTRIRLQHWGIKDRNTKFCEACLKVVQSHAYLFWRCSVVCSLWNIVWNLTLITWPDWNLHR
jgi:hypothetical protein